MSKRRRGPSKEERLKKLEKGLAWCSYHLTWEDVSGFGASKKSLSGCQSECRKAGRVRADSRRRAANIPKRMSPGKTERLEMASQGMSWCTGHRRWEPVSAFRADPLKTSGRQPVCREYYNNGRRGMRNSQAHLRSQFNITSEEKNAVFLAQGSCCAFCGSEQHGHRFDWPVDHDHSFPRGDRRGVRGILCQECNAHLIGVIESKAMKMNITEEALLERVLDYIRNNRLRTQAVLDQRRNSESGT